MEACQDEACQDEAEIPLWGQCLRGRRVRAVEPQGVPAGGGDPETPREPQQVKWKVPLLVWGLLLVGMLLGLLQALGLLPALGLLVQTEWQLGQVYWACEILQASSTLTF